MLNDEGVYFTFFYYLHLIMTWGYIPHILFGLSISILFMFLIILIKERKMPLYTFREKYRYTKYFTYLYIMEKVNFIRFTILEFKFFIESRDGFKFWVRVAIVCVIVTIIFIFAWDSITKILQQRAEDKFNSSLTNITS